MILQDKIEVLRGRPVQLPLCLPRSPHEQAWDRNRAVTERDQKLTAWSMTQSYNLHPLSLYLDYNFH